MKNKKKPWVKPELKELGTNIEGGTKFDPKENTTYGPGS